METIRTSTNFGMSTTQRQDDDGFRSKSNAIINEGCDNTITTLGMMLQNFVDSADRNEQKESRISFRQINKNVCVLHFYVIGHFSV